MADPNQPFSVLYRT